MAWLFKVFSVFTLFLSLGCAWQDHSGDTPAHSPQFEKRGAEPLEGENSSSYIIALKDGLAFQGSLLNDIKQIMGVSAIIKQDLTGGKIFNGIAIELGVPVDISAAIDKIKQISGVLGVAHNEAFQVPRIEVKDAVRLLENKNTESNRQGHTHTTSAVNQLYSNDQIMIQADLLRERGYTGKGIRVALIDAAADTTHPGIKIDFLTDYRQPDDRDWDGSCSEHATACASTISSIPSEEGGWQGIAPGVELGNYIVSGCKKPAVDGAFIMALEQAIVDQVNIISMSASWGPNWAFQAFEDDVRLFEKVAKRGILFVVSGGNGGNMGLYKPGLSCATPFNLCVGMVENTHYPEWQNMSYTSKPKEKGKGGRMDWISSWGPTFDGSTGVDIAAPGTEMPVLMPGNNRAFAGGTSFAAPIVAGAAALVAQALETTDMVRVANVLTSTTKLLDRDPGGGWGPGYASVAHQGAGMVQLDRATSAAAYVNVRNLEFNQTSYRTPKSVEIINTGGTELVFQVSNVPAGTVNSLYASFQPVGNVEDINNKHYVQSGAILEFSHDEVWVPPYGKTRIQVTAVDPKDLDANLLPVWSGWIMFKAPDGFTISVPYLGFKGDLDRTPKAYKVEVSPKSATFPDQNVTHVMSMGMGSRWVKTYLHYAGNGTRAWQDPIWEMGTLYNVTVEEYWYGDLGPGRAAAGEYLFRTECLRAFAERQNPTTPEDFVTIDTEPFTIARSN